MMFRLGAFKYGETEDDQAVELDYLGSDLAMVVVLPTRRDGLSRLEARLSGCRMPSIPGRRTSRA